MKKHIIPAIILVFFALQGVSQKYAYVDSEYILDNIPEYKDAQDQLDELAVEYQKEIEEKYAEIDKLYKQFQAESVLLPDELKKKREDEIIKMENDVKNLQKQRFGKEGDLFQKREELVRPIQEKIYNAIEEISEEKNYAFVFDKAGSLTMLYVNPKFDISDDILDKVGAVMGTVRKEDRVKKGYTPPKQNAGDNKTMNKTGDTKTQDNERSGGIMPPNPTKKK